MKLLAAPEKQADALEAVTPQPDVIDDLEGALALVWYRLEPLEYRAVMDRFALVKFHTAQVVVQLETMHGARTYKGQAVREDHFPHGFAEPCYRQVGVLVRSLKAV